MYYMGPHLKKGITLFEDIQKFTLKMCTKLWDQDYQSMLSISNLLYEALQDQRLLQCNKFHIANSSAIFSSGKY